LKGRRDRCSGCRRKGSREREKPEKISHFLFGREAKKYYLCRPKSKIKREGILQSEGEGGYKFFEIMK
jgi:hypothetical protein